MVINRGLQHSQMRNFLQLAEGAYDDNISQGGASDQCEEGEEEEEGQEEEEGEEEEEEEGEEEGSGAHVLLV